MSTVLWIVGEPGIGKTTLARALIERFKVVATTEVAKPKWTLFGNIQYPRLIAAAGTWRGDKFDGADTLPISDIKPAMAYWAEHLSDHRLTILDGDKLSTKGAVEVVRKTSARVLCVLLDDCGERIAEHRRELRGTKQDPTWVRGRVTKARNFWSINFTIYERLGMGSSVALREQVDRVLGFLGPV